MMQEQDTAVVHLSATHLPSASPKLMPSDSLPPTTHSSTAPVTPPAAPHPCWPCCCSPLPALAPAAERVSPAFSLPPGHSLTLPLRLALPPVPLPLLPPPSPWLVLLQDWMQAA